MQNRETKELEVAGHKIVVKTYLNGAESDIAQAVMFNGVLSPTEKGASAKIPFTNLLAFNKKRIELVLVSVDGIAENPIAKLDEMAQKIRDDIFAEITKITGLSLVEAK